MKDVVGDAGEDEVLIEIANRLASRGAASDALIARLRGDKFGLVMPAADAGRALAVAQTARDAISRAIWINQVVQVSANVGVCDGAARWRARARS